MGGWPLMDVIQVCGWWSPPLQISRAAPIWCILYKFKNSFLLFLQSSVNWIMYTGEAVNKLPGFVYSKLLAWCYLLQMSKYQMFWMSGVSQKKKNSHLFGWLCWQRKGHSWGLTESHFLLLLIDCTHRERVWCTLSNVWILCSVFLQESWIV